MLDQDYVRASVDEIISDFLDHKARTNVPGPAGVKTAWPEITEILRGFIATGGKRLRPLLCTVGWYAAGGGPHPESLLRAAASLEMFHAFALIHDDVMDDSPTRRGRPTLHRAPVGGLPGIARAILVGDLALAWSDELLHTAGLATEQLTRVLPLVDAMRSEVMYGQYLDVTSTGRPDPELDHALTIARYKTATYTVERPLHIGAALAHPDAPNTSLSAYALPIGEAFQLRDDLLGTFGTEALTGKSTLDDLRDGKHTALVSLALRDADPGQRRTLRALVGDPALDEDGARRVRGVLIATGARDAVEKLIAVRHQEALTALDQAAFPPAADAALRSIARAAEGRRS